MSRRKTIQPVRGKPPRNKPRLGVMPTRIERKATAYRRHPKHKSRDLGGFPVGWGNLPTGKSLTASAAGGPHER